MGLFRLGAARRRNVGTLTRKNNRHCMAHRRRQKLLVNSIDYEQN
jgi:hypothetical protein